MPIFRTLVEILKTKCVLTLLSIENVAALGWSICGM